jgi:glycosyltransferase involved in cell wall biosynthesis
MDVSLLICSRNRCKQLVDCLQSVQGIRFERSWELIVVNNASEDETAAVIQEFIDTASFPVRYVFEPKLGKSNGLNTAIGLARGQILAFTDDDCYPAPDFLSRVWMAFEDKSVGYITGRIVLHDPADDPVATNESTIPLTFPGRSFVWVGVVSGANMAFRRSILCQIGGFDPLFGVGSLFPAEDADVAGRASAIGWKGQYRPEVVVRHHHRRKASDRAPLCKAYGIGRGAYHMKLLLREREFWWFAKSVYRIPGRYKADRRMLMWELVGSAKYAYLYLTGVCRSLGRVRDRPQ